MDMNEVPRKKVVIVRRKTNGAQPRQYPPQEGYAPRGDYGKKPYAPRPDNPDWKPRPKFKKKNPQEQKCKWFLRKHPSGGVLDLPRNFTIKEGTSVLAKCMETNDSIVDVKQVVRDLRLLVNNPLLHDKELLYHVNNLANTNMLKYIKMLKIAVYNFDRYHPLCESLRDYATKTGNPGGEWNSSYLKHYRWRYLEEGGEYPSKPLLCQVYIKNENGGHRFATAQYSAEAKQWLPFGGWSFAPDEKVTIWRYQEDPVHTYAKKMQREKAFEAKRALKAEEAESNGDAGKVEEK